MVRNVVSRTSWLATGFMVLACLASLPLMAELSAVVGSALYAQEGDAPAPAAAPAAPAAAPAGQAAPVAQKNMLAWTYEALGFRYTAAFLFISFAFIAMLVMNLLSARRDAVCPSHLVEGFEEQVNEKQAQAAYDLAINDESVLGKVLAAGMEKMQSGGMDAALKAMQETGEDENMKIEHRLSYLALIGTVAPMVGLLGTVDGMVASFSVIAASTSTPKPAELAQGICMALVTTLVGLVIAIPAISIFNILKNRMSRLMLETGIYSENLINGYSKMKP
ncbi:MAG: MotA/TolQ/ExbB proton channel family protein [Planctomycetota bacterium]